ncbi:MAG: chromosome segregation SMC family protein [Candidatus Doudnabacteria bacterium]|nr:chromosome segregation SMC family protein [Candidatus Doudnabacteria bacterium]
MYLKRLEIHGFKSFAQKTALEFSAGIIAIVGPNGSGKSNVADAMRWVLGEQSAKAIRGKKSDDVIFAGSDKKTRQGFAEVVATFDNSDHRIPLDASEVSIGRRIDRSGESEYLINGNKVRLLDIVDLVLKSNIGTSRYTVIGQGTIDQMVMQGPPGVKDLVDEASGVKNYYIKRDKTLRRLEQTAQNLMRAEDLIAEIEPRLKSLRRQAKKLEARAELEQELKIYRREFYGRSFWQFKETSDKILQQLSEIEEHKKAGETKAANLRQQAEGLEQAGQQSGGTFAKIQEEFHKLQAQKNRLLEDLSLVRGKMQSQKTAVAGDAQSLTVEVHNKHGKIQEVTGQIQNTLETQKQLENKFVDQFKSLETVNKKLDELSKKLSNPAQIDWNLVELELRVLEEAWQKFSQMLVQAVNLEEIKHQANSMEESFTRFRKAAKQTVADPRLGLEAVKQELDQLLKQKEVLNQEVNNAQLEMSKGKIAVDFLQRELAALQQEKLHLDLELKKVQSSSPDEFWQNLLSEEKRIQADVDKLGQEMAKVETELKLHYSEQEKRQAGLRGAEGQFRLAQDELSKIKDKESIINIEKAKIDTQLQLLAEEVVKTLGQPEWQTLGESKVATSTDDLENKIARLKNQLETIGGMDELTLKEYQETETRHQNLSTQVADLQKGMTDLRQVIDDLDGRIKDTFNEAFRKISEKFEFYFRVLFNGGRGYLSVIKNEPPEELPVEAGAEADDNQPQDLRPEEKVLQKYEHTGNAISGIDIKATPPGKKLASIQALSGGERAMTSIALLCSLLTCFPSPCVVLDEVDAALDDANTIRFGQILGTLAHQTQFLTITHNRETMTQANILYGVTMGDDGVSKLLSVKLDQAKQYAK